MDKKDMDLMQWASDLYSREVRGDIFEAEEQSGVPIEIPLGFSTPETLEQQIKRLVRAYSTDTGIEVESIDEANDFSIPGEDVDYEEEDYIVDNMEQNVVNSLPPSNQDDSTEAATTPADVKDEPADNAGS